MIELTVHIEEKEGEVWCTAETCEWRFATDKERTVLKEDFLPLLDDDKHTMGALKGLNSTQEDDDQLELDFDIDDDSFHDDVPFDIDDPFDECLDDWDDGWLVLDNAPEDDSFF